MIIVILISRLIKNYIDCKKKFSFDQCLIRYRCFLRGCAAQKSEL